MNIDYQNNFGSWLFDLESREVESVLRAVQGNYILQLGGVSEKTHVPPSPLFYRMRLITAPIAEKIACLQADWDDLPLQPNSVDVLLLVHVLEYADHPVKVLKEVYQALKPGGRVVILGFNPWSLFGVCKWGYRGHLRHAKLWSVAQIKHWLHNYHYHISAYKTFCYYLPRHRPSMPWAASFISVLGQWCFPANGGIFLLVAEKRVSQLIDFQTVWWRKSPQLRGVVGPIPRV